MLPGVHRGQGPDFASLVRLHGCLWPRYAESQRVKRKPANFRALEKELLSMLTDEKRPGSLPRTLAEVSRIGGSVRERLSADMMLLIGQLRNAMHGEPDAQLLDYRAMLTACLQLLSAFTGMERENINRGSGWLFMGIGRRLERAIYLTRQLREITRPLAMEDWSFADWPFLERLLEVEDSSVTYRARYYTTLQPLAVLDVLMADPTNPRSLDFQLEHLAELYEKLPRRLSANLQTIQNATTALRAIDLKSVRNPSQEKMGVKTSNDEKAYIKMDRYLADLESLLPSWSNDLSNQYFSHIRTQLVLMGE
jgi:uncharacterized alpha-E superfamily protein